MRKNSNPEGIKPKPTSPPAENQGEGDKKSAERFNREARDFVASEHGRGEIRKAGKVDASEKQALKDAERAGHARSKGEDPAVSRKR